MTGKKSIGRKLSRGRRKAVTMAPEEMITGQLLYAEKAIPYVIQPAVEGINLSEWAENNRPYVESLFAKHRALLFRDFAIEGVGDFEAFVAATSDGEPLEYRDRSTPRTSEGNRIYTSTIHPADQRINAHNEGTYWTRWATKIYFSCMTAPAKGGQTPIFNVANVYNRLPIEIREKFKAKKWMLVRNYNDGFGLPWQEVFQTDSREEVEAYCRAHDIQYEWKDDGRLRTRSIRPAIHTHPQTQDPLWFNHAAFFHYTTLEDEVREALLRDFGVDELPYNTYYGDGSPLDPADVQVIRDAYEAEKVMFRWQPGDIMFLDNMYMAHGREPYKGERLIVVAMTEPVGLAETALG